jgi:peptide/nickel transport system substrate-binding protein
MPHRRRLVAAALVLGAVCVGAALALGGGGQGDGLGHIDGNAVGLIDPGDGRITTQYGVGRGPNALVAGGGSTWVSNATDNTVSRIDGRRGDQVTSIPAGTEPGGLAFAGGSLWVANPRDRSVSQIAPATNAVAGRIEVGNGPSAIVAASGSVWVASEIDRTVTRIDPMRGVLRPGVIPLGAEPSAMAAGAGAIWVTSEQAGTLFRIDARTATVTDTIPVGHAPAGVAVDGGAVWVANRQDNAVWRIDAVTRTPTDNVRVGRAPVAIAAEGGDVWVGNSGDGTVSRIDGAKRAVTRTIDVHGSPSAIRVGGGAVWTAALIPVADHRGGTLRVQMPTEFEIDPGFYDTETARLTSVVYDGLLAYRRADGESFGALVGDLATSVPNASPDGKTYVFTLRPGVRFSDGRIVQPADFRASIENLLRRHPDNAVSTFERIPGARACGRRPARCDLSRGIVTDARARTIAIHLTAPDPELLHKLAFPFTFVVPADRPFRGRRAPPGTGPYRFVSFRYSHSARLERNPYFHVWSDDARPGGVADRIDVTMSDDINSQVADVERGTADVVTVAGVFGGRLSASRLRALRSRSVGRLFSYAEPELDAMFLNVHTPPFDDVRVRRAVNYAVDRERIVAAAGGSDLAELACQYVPRGFPGYTPSCRYTVHPEPGGSWTGPDLQRARRLVRISGTRGMRVTLWGQEDKRPLDTYIASVLRRLGYHTSVRWYPDYFRLHDHTADSRTGAQIGNTGWSADFGAASDFAVPYLCRTFNPRTRNNANDGQFCNPGIDALNDRALAAHGADADRLWHALYRRLDDAAPAIPLVNRRSVSLVSKRVGNFQHHPLWGTLLDQLWVR